jgi:hypothetical protein|tara:strand:- start:770 stop:1435 length:666 start_codon:yes stop_codon:yes gene_type:complete
MGYLDNSSITVDAILTKKGRELLAKGRDFFVISQFALADDEVDYELWNAAHPLGSDYYGIIIENMPIVEAVTDESYSLKYKLLTLPKNTIRIPQIVPNPTDVTLEEGGNQQVITLTTKNGGNETLGYTVTLINSDAASIVGDGNGIANNADPVGPNEDKRSITISTNSTFTITSKVLADNVDISTRVVVVGNETGGREEITITVTNNPDISVGNTIDGGTL